MNIPYIKDAKIKDYEIKYKNDADTVSDEFKINKYQSSIEIININYLLPCIETIIKNNLDAVYYAVSYEKEIVYFYTDKKIDLSSWTKEHDIQEKRELTLEALKNIVNSKDMLEDEDLISIKFLNICIENIRKAYDTDLQNLTDKINMLTGNEIDYLGWENENNFFIEFNNQCLRFEKDGDDFILKNSYIRYIDLWDNILKLWNEVYDYLLNIYNFFLKYNSFLTFCSKDYFSFYKLKIVNSNDNLNFKFSDTNWILYKYYKKKNLLYISLENEHIIFDSNYFEIAKYVTEHKDILIDKLYVKISECPEWMQKELYNLKKEQIYKNNMVTIERKEVPKRNFLSLKKRH